MFLTLPFFLLNCTITPPVEKIKDPAKTFQNPPTKKKKKKKKTNLHEK
jgi:hypothetical protein